VARARAVVSPRLGALSPLFYILGPSAPPLNPSFPCCYDFFFFLPWTSPVYSCVLLLLPVPLFFSSSFSVLQPTAVFFLFQPLVLICIYLCFPHNFCGLFPGVLFLPIRAVPCPCLPSLCLSFLLFLSLCLAHCCCFFSFCNSLSLFSFLFISYSL